MRVAVLGASPNAERYANKAVKALRRHGHEVVPVTPGHAVIEGIPAVPSLAGAAAVHTVTVYVGPKNVEPLVDGIVAAKPQRVIANPGAESAVLRKAVEAAGIQYVEACTLVMLATGQF